MFKILYREELAENIKKFIVDAPEIAKRAQAGQFVIIRLTDKGERIPLTVADKVNNTITLIFQEVGKTTMSLGCLKEGDYINDIVGPLGHPTDTKNIGTVVAVGGGVGVAEVLPVAKAYKSSGNKVIGIIGARNKELIILEKDMKEACDEVYVTTDDGSYSRKGFVSNVLQELIDKKADINLVYAIGPVPMMKVVSNLTKPYNIKTIVSLNPIMVDGTGMCGACRVSVNNETKFACVDGPEFDGHKVNWEELVMRLGIFKDKEKASLEKFKTECKCKK